MHDLFLSAAEAPRPWPLPGVAAPELPGTWRDRLAALPPGDVRITGGEPLALPELPELLALLDAEGRRVVLHTDLPGLDDDLNVRPFAPFDVRFLVRRPTADATAFRALTGMELEPVEMGLRNLQAFAYPFDAEILVGRRTQHHLADDIVRVLKTGQLREVRLRPLAGDEAPSWRAIGEQLLVLEGMRVRPHPRVVLDGIPALALPVDALEDVDVRTPDRADVPAPTDAPHEGDAPSRDEVARRRIWLATPERDRPGRRGHPLDRLAEATAVVLVRPGHGAFAVIDRVRDGVPALARTERHMLYLVGRFEDPVLAERFHDLARQLYARVKASPPDDLARLREIAHVLRRSMKPKHDGEPVQVREEGH